MKIPAALRRCLWVLPPLVAAWLPAADLPPLLIPEGVGVNIHFTRGHERDLDLIAAAGFRFVRMDFVWQATERRPGEYDWSDYDELTANLDQRGLRALYILDYSNPLYEVTVSTTNPITGKAEHNLASPQRPESVAAFARWAGEAARHFQGRRVIWEIWNEPNIFFWRPKPDARQYLTLALATARAVRAADPKATLIGPATSEIPQAFLETLFQGGLLEHLDAVSVHPYRDYKRGPETALADYARLRELVDRHAPPDRKGKLPLLSGEWGYATHDRGVSLETQAAFAVRQQLANLRDGVPLSIWYDWKNDGPDPKEREHNFGVVRADLTPKPAYTALQTMTATLKGFRCERRHATGDDADWVLVFRNEAGETKLALWTTGAEREVELPLDPKEPATFRLITPMGERLSLAATSPTPAFKLTAQPQFLELGKRGLAR